MTMRTVFLSRLLALILPICLLTPLRSPAQSSHMMFSSIISADDLPDSLSEESFGLLPENPNDQPHFLPIASDPLRPDPLSDTSIWGRWDPRFGMPGLNGDVHAIARVDNELFVGGSFTVAGGQIANYIARWDGNAWHTLANGLDGYVYAIAISGDDVFVGGTFTNASGLPANRIARWSRKAQRWFPLGDGVGGSRFAYVASLAADGDDLYVGGRFLTVGRIVAVNIAHWNSGRWSRVGGGANGYVFSLRIDGDDLYVGGRFTVADDKPIRRIARVDRATNQWEEIADGVRYKDSGYVSAIEMAGQGKEIYIGGKFRTNGGGEHLLNSVARYDEEGRKWEDLGLGVNMQLELTDVYALAARGNQLFVGGRFDSVDTILSGFRPNSQRAYNFGRWNADTRTWSLLTRDLPGWGKKPSGVANIGPNRPYRNMESAFIAALAFDDHQRLVIGGSFNIAGPIVETKGVGAGIIPLVEDVLCNNICLFDTDTTWSLLGSGLGGPAFALASLGDLVVIGGEFNTAGPISASNIALWNSASGAWTSLGSGLSGPVRALAADNSAIFAAGSFASIDQTSPARVARWDLATTRWSPIPDAPFAQNSTVHALAIHDGILYAGADDGIFAFDGSLWSPLGSNLDGPVFAIATDGDDLIVGGQFSSADGLSLNSLARWSTTDNAWSPIGNGVSGQVNAILVEGERIFVGGKFSSVGGISARNIAVWNSSANAWTTLGDGIDGSINALATLNGSIFAAGSFPSIGIFSMNSISRWDGYDWYDVDRGLVDKDGEANVYALTTGSAALYAGGYFIRAGGTTSYNFGRWTNIASSVDKADRRGVAGTSLEIWPTPVRAAATIRFRLEHEADVRITIFDPAGRELGHLVDETMDAGEHRIEWRTDGLAPGIYFCRLQLDGATTTTTSVTAY